MMEDYTRRFSKLRTDTSPSRWPVTTRHRAPHKPLLLLAVMDLFAEGSVTANLIELTPDLGELFTLYWARVMPPDQRGNLALPFFHLKSDRFWHLVPRPGHEAFLDATHQIRSINQLRDTVLGARLDDELYELFCSDSSRDVLRTVLIESYFAPEAQSALIEQGFINVESFRYSQELLEQARRRQAKERPLDEDTYQPVVRDQGFRRAMVTAYDHRCALCGIRMLTPDGHTVVDAAHIIPWRISHNDDPGNGMALCRLCHWTFDEGLASVSSRYLVIISPQLTTGQNFPGHLVTLGGRGIIGPNEESLWPDLDALSWHRRNTFRRR
ncbi:MAG TPA: HNH endonuclease [Chloroflexi bacterium]|nr:HNH endonuclease [Chloroflexota bacterium]